MPSGKLKKTSKKLKEDPYLVIKWYWTNYFKKYGHKLKISRVSFSENDRAITDNKKLGWIEIYIYRNFVVGASVVGIGAGELLNFWSFMISNRISIYKVARTSFAYPTLGEVNKKLITNYIGPKFFNNSLIRNMVRLTQKFLP